MEASQRIKMGASLAHLLHETTLLVGLMAGMYWQKDNHPGRKRSMYSMAWRTVCQQPMKPKFKSEKPLWMTESYVRPISVNLTIHFHMFCYDGIKGISLSCTPESTVQMTRGSTHASHQWVLDTYPNEYWEAEADMGWFRKDRGGDQARGGRQQQGGCGWEHHQILSLFPDLDFPSLRLFGYIPAKDLTQV